MAGTASPSATPHETTSEIETIELDPRGEREIGPSITQVGGEIKTTDVEVKIGSEGAFPSSSSSDDSETETVVSQLLEAAKKNDSVGLHSMIEQLGLTKLLHHSAQTGNIDLLEIALKDPRTDVNAQQGFGCTALIIACWKGHTEIVRWLLLRDADVLLGTEDGLTCLHMAAFCGHTEIVNLLLHGKIHRAGLDKADPSLPVLSSKRCWALIDRRTSAEMFTALHMAASASHDPWAVVLDEMVGTSGRSEEKILEDLRTSEMFDSLGLEKYWLSKDAAIQQSARSWDRDRDAPPPQPESVQAGANDRINMPVSHDQGVPIAASILEALRSSVLDLSGLASNPKAAYHIEDELWLDYLIKIRKELHLQHGEISPQVVLKNLAAYGNDGGAGSGLRGKLAEKYEGLVRAYMELILYSNARDAVGRTALHHAAWEGKDKLVKFFMWDSGIANPKDSKRQGLKELDPLKSQLGGVANVNVVDVDGHTPLHLSSRKGSRDVVEELLRGNTFVSYLGTLIGSNRALPHKLLENLFIKDNYLQPNPAANPCGRSQERARAIRSRIEKLGNKQNRQPIHMPRPSMEDSIWSDHRTGITPLHYAVENEYADVVDVLIMHPKIDVFQNASNGQSPWSIAFPPHMNPSRSPYTETQLLLRGDVNSPSLAMSSVVLFPMFGFYWQKLHRQHQERLLKRATALALAAENDSYASDNLEILVDQIFVTFEGALAKDPNLPRITVADFDRESGPNNICSKHLLHMVAYYGCEQELQTLLTLPTYKRHLNGSTGLTTLQFAILGGRDAVAVLMNEDRLDLTESVAGSGTPLDFIDGLIQEQEQDHQNLQSLQEAKKILTQVLVPVLENNFYRDRQVYVDAANAILVGAALIASVTFAGYLQPPLGYVQYFTENTPYPAPPSTPESFAAVGQHTSVRVFWVFNGLSFFSAIATVLAGAGAVLPSSDDSIDKEVRIVRKWLMVTSGLLAVSIVCVLGAFTAAGSASLPNISKYQFNIVSIAAIGLPLCMATLVAFCYRLFLSIKRGPLNSLIVFLVLPVTLEACVALFFLCKPLMHRIANG